VPRRAAARPPPLVTDRPEPEADLDERITSAKAYAEEIRNIAQAGKDEDRLDIWLKATMHYGELWGFGAGCLAPKADAAVDEDELSQDPKVLLEQMLQAVKALEKKVGGGRG
jgi:hypothetical protein